MERGDCGNVEADHLGELYGHDSCGACSTPTQDPFLLVVFGRCGVHVEDGRGMGPWYREGEDIKKRRDEPNANANRRTLLKCFPLWQMACICFLRNRELHEASIYIPRVGMTMLTP